MEIQIQMDIHSNIYLNVVFKYIWRKIHLNFNFH